MRKFVVVPPMSGGLEKLREIAGNLWFSWNAEAAELFEHLDEKQWIESKHNPVKTLISLSSKRLEDLQSDEGYRSHAERVFQRFRAYMDKRRPYDFGLSGPIDFTTAFFSIEFGLTECLPLHSGELGLFAGNLLKSASDVNLPMVGVGLLYQEGYFRQRLSADGMQQEYYPRTDFDILPMDRVFDESGSELTVSVTLGNEVIKLRLFRVDVGRCKLYLLDADIPENDPKQRRITARLYDGDQDMRIRQEMVLGLGGVRALDALGIEPMVFHLNEGHVAFTILERIRMFVEREGLSIEEASTLATAQTVVTFHSNGPAGNDSFHAGAMGYYFSEYLRALNMDLDWLMGLGRINPHNEAEPFSMGALSLRLSSYANGVSQIHTSNLKRRWSPMWPNTGPEDSPFQTITSGVHVPSCASRDLLKLYDRYLGFGWSEDPDCEKVWQRAEQIPDTELWRNHERGRMRLVSFTRRRLVEQLKIRGAPAQEIELASGALDPETLTICCISRFAAYQRPLLIFKDLRRLAKIIDDAGRPVQFIFSGKAHPADSGGKDLIKRLYEFCRAKPFQDRIVFIEDYDLDVADLMAQGADVWLGLSRRPNEACGVYGMLAAANGALNLSVRDGWWNEAYSGDNGWTIGAGEEYENPEYQDYIESRALYDLLEESVKPAFYERTADDLPRAWLDMMKRSISGVCPVHNTHRMLNDYVEKRYLPALRSATDLINDDYKKLRELVSWHKDLKQEWHGVQIRKVEIPPEEESLKGRSVKVKAYVDTGGRNPDDLLVEVLHGPIDLWDNFLERYIARLKPSDQEGGPAGETVFSGGMPLEHAGLYGYLVRITANNPNLPPTKKHEIVRIG
jgi:starch phosphorylase